MTKIYLNVTGASASAEKIGPLTTGMVGVPVECSFSQEWDTLNRLMVFRAGEIKKDNTLQEGKSFVPAEALTQPGQMLYIGVEGRSKDGTVVIPTVWAEAGKILYGACASGDPALAPTPSQFERFMAEVEKVDEKIEAAMTQAKASGEFDGEKGDKGDKGEKGDKGDKGDKGEKGDIGKAFTYADLTVAERAALKGEKGDTPYVFTTTYTAKENDIGSIHYIPISTIDESEKAVEMGDLLISNEGNLYRALSANLGSATLIKSELLAVLKGEAGSVTSVNGVAPDADGNVEIEAGGVSSWDDMPAPMPDKFIPDSVVRVEKGILLTETDAVEGTDPNFGKCWMVNKAPNLTAGETYTVVYNGVPYDCVCGSGDDSGLSFAEGAFLMGNHSVIGGENTGEPFAMVIFPAYQTIVCLDLTGAASVRIGIMGWENVLNVFVDTPYSNNMAADKNSEEIWQEVKDGKNVFLYYGTSICSFVGYRPGQCAVFAYPNVSSTSGKVDGIYGIGGIIVTQDGSVLTS